MTPQLINVTTQALVLYLKGGGGEGWSNTLASIIYGSNLFIAS